MNKIELELLVKDGLSIYEISKKLNKPYSTIRYWLNKHNLGTKKVYKCGNCGDTNPANFFIGRFTQCKRCRRSGQNNLTQRYKRELVKYKGGKCEICGYDKCIAALDFHHINPNEKSPNWKRMRAWTTEKVKKEVDKCQLVCRNCHSEIHYGTKQLT